MTQISAHYIGNLFEYGCCIGIEEKRLRFFLEEESLDVCSKSTFVTSKEFEDTFCALFRASNNRCFGLGFASFLNLKALGLIHQLSVEAKDFQQVLFLMEEYFKHTFPIVSFKVDVSEGVFTINLSCSLGDLDLRNQLLDVIVCFIYRELSVMMKQEDLPKLYSPNVWAEEYKRYIDVDILRGDFALKFGKLPVEIEINKGKLGQLEVLIPQFLKILNKEVGYLDFSTRIRNMILNMCKPELPSFSDVASHFAMSERGIQRKLKEEGSTFRKISNQVKKELAEYLSHNSSMKTMDIAFVLGYSDASSYLHAAKKWNLR